MHSDAQFQFSDCSLHCEVSLYDHSLTCRCIGANSHLVQLLLTCTRHHLQHEQRYTSFSQNSGHKNKKCPENKLFSRKKVHFYIRLTPQIPTDHAHRGETFCLQELYPCNQRSSSASVWCLTSRGNAHCVMWTTICWAALSWSCPVFTLTVMYTTTALN